MAKIFNQFNGVEVFFLICAIVGGIFVLIRLIMQFIGADHHDAHHFETNHTDSDVGFTMLSLHGLTSFFMMFGLVGLAVYRNVQLGIFISIFCAIAAGLASVWFIGKLFFLAMKLQSSGTITIDHTIGTQGKVYLTIPENGTGRVLINVNKSLREYDASSHNEKEISTGTPIRVVWVDGNILVVERI